MVLAPPAREASGPRRAAARLAMMLDERKDHDDRLDERKEIKVRIPVRYHVNLHSLKVLTGKNISTAVTEAIEGYFDELREARDGPGEAVHHADVPEHAEPTEPGTADA